ncbi:hypothetical protein CDD82_5660 [Ophiocordyceps australis]|uniref:Trehalase n=1 Tax=Ophiocordyceps australis TaxID=1399860 RepID=A0A2C5XI03_9HYPO|nr:hypothetical protein CDD82_5660 [Ophiocordyceps australis]
MALFAGGASALWTSPNGSVVAPCDSVIYCHGDMLHQIELAKPFSDSKTFVDMPAKEPLEAIQAGFDQLTKPLSNNSDLHDFLDKYFHPAGEELKAVDHDSLDTAPDFLDRVSDPVVREFTQQVIGIWPDLTRTYQAPECSECENSFIAINRTFVVAGGRFREPYYWDSYWILEGLLRTRGAFTQVARDIIENFVDMVDRFGFIPNGARVYYLNRSQPPLLAQMVRIYIEHTNDTSILERTLPLLVKEYSFWQTNRTVDVSVGGKTFSLNRYAVSNTVPRPESYREDWEMARNTTFFDAKDGSETPARHQLNETEQAVLYANLASGAETGWDYTSRWIARPGDAAAHQFPLRSLNTREIVPVDLNSILYANEKAIGDFFRITGNDSAGSEWHAAARKRSDAMHAVMWNQTLWSYFDFNLTSGAQNIYVPADNDTLPIDKKTAGDDEQVFFHAAQFFPFWTGAANHCIRQSPKALVRAYSRIAAYLDARPGGIPATNLRTTQQWDQPNVWPPLMHPLIEGLLSTPPPASGPDDADYRAVQDLALRLAQRYLDSTFCAWYATGGSTEQTPKLPGLGPDDKGIMFEKYSDSSTSVAGGGGEYEVVEGFGWTNGVLIWAADKFADKLVRPDCGNITAAPSKQQQQQERKRSAVELHSWDAAWVKRFASQRAA